MPQHGGAYNNILYSSTLNKLPHYYTFVLLYCVQYKFRLATEPTARCPIKRLF